MNHPIDWSSRAEELAGKLDDVAKERDAARAMLAEAAGLLARAADHLTSSADIIEDLTSADEEDLADERQFISDIRAFVNPISRPADSAPVEPTGCSCDTPSTVHDVACGESKPDPGSRDVWAAIEELRDWTGFDLTSPSNLWECVKGIDANERDVRGALTKTACCIDGRIDDLDRRVKALEGWQYSMLVDRSAALPAPVAAPEQRRAIDLCSCGHAKALHAYGVGKTGPFTCGNAGCGCDAFTPHPQPKPETAGPGHAFEPYCQTECDKCQFCFKKGCNKLRTDPIHASPKTKGEG